MLPGLGSQAGWDQQLQAACLASSPEVHIGDQDGSPRSNSRIQRGRSCAILRHWSPRRGRAYIGSESDALVACLIALVMSPAVPAMPISPTPLIPSAFT